MDIFERIRYDLWPFLKTRIILWYWTIKHGGKKNIPKEVVFAQMGKSLERLKQNLNCARAAAMDGASMKEMDEIYETIKKVENLECDVEKFQKSNN